MSIAPRERSLLLGGISLSALWGLSYSLSVLSPGLLHHHCLFGLDATWPDRSVCELAFGGLWVSLTIGVAAGLLATVVGATIAVLARRAGSVVESGMLRLCDAFFALPDVLVLMVLQLAAQNLQDVYPAFKVAPMILMIISLSLVGWAAPARMIRNRIATVEEEDFVRAARALGAGWTHVLVAHVWPVLRAYVAAIFLSRVPAAILAESTVSFLGIARVEPMSLGRYLGASFGNLLYPGGARMVLPAWFLLVAIVFITWTTSRRVLARAE